MKGKIGERRFLLGEGRAGKGKTRKLMENGGRRKKARQNRGLNDEDFDSYKIGLMLKRIVKRKESIFAGNC